MVRIVIAGIVAGLLVFVWGAIAHTVLPLGMAGMQVPTADAQNAALTALQGSFDQEGIYLLPLPPEEVWEDDAAMARFGAEAAKRPYAFVVYQPRGTDINAGFGGLLARQAGLDVLAALVAAFVAAGIAGSLLRRALSVAAMGVFAWLAMAAPYWNWYRFPADFVGAALIEQAVGWLIGGFAIAWLLRARPA
jgi:hypothetical protein